MARRTGDRRRDVSEALRERLLVRLAACGDAAIEARRFVAEGGTPSARARLEAAGDDLPLGLVLDA
jgi:hypothetical protein